MFLTYSNAQSVKFEEAEQIAVNFYFERINQTEYVPYEKIAIYDYRIEMINDVPSYFIIRMKPAGFVIVSATKKVIPVLAYSFGAKTPLNIFPPQFSAWTEQYKKQIEYAISENIKPSVQIGKEWKRLMTDDISNLNIIKQGKDVAPMLISTWNQGNYYNQMCPEDPSGPAGHCYTGCVATAMGQLCYYFRWPDTGTGSYTYQLPDYGTISANFEDTHYNWNGMTNNLAEENLAVAELLFHLGVSVDMDYGPDGSGMWNHKAAYSLRTFFKYSQETEYLFRDSTNLNWDSVIVAHLDKKIPLYYAGWSEPNVSGHAFVCDGYQDEDYFHFNWGWGGSWDGYFYIDTLTPGGSNFNLAQELVINCYPDTLNYSYPGFCPGNDTLTTFDGSIDDGSGPLYDYENNTICSWLISPQSVEDSVSSIKLFFDRMDTEETNDIVTVYDGATFSSPILGQFSGTDIPDEVASTGNEVLITFETNGNITSQGWQLHYSCERPQWCSGMADITEIFDTIEDGSGTFYYHNGTSCMWHIHPSGIDFISLLLTEFETEENFDVLKIVNGENNQVIGELSGIYDPDTLATMIFMCPSPDMYLIFSSNQTVTYQGWKMVYYGIIAGDDNHSFARESVHIFPNPAKDKLNISFNVLKSCDLAITIFTPDGIVQKKMYFQNITGKQNLYININDLSKGVYLISLEGDKVKYVGKFIKG